MQINHTIVIVYCKLCAHSSRILENEASDILYFSCINKWKDENQQLIDPTNKNCLCTTFLWSVKVKNY